MITILLSFLSSRKRLVLLKTLLKLISMIERPSIGNVLINGKNLNQITPNQVPFARRDIGIIFQNHRFSLYFEKFMYFKFYRE